jgi:hypothetical protein
MASLSRQRTSPGRRIHAQLIRDIVDKINERERGGSEVGAYLSACVISGGAPSLMSAV